MALSVPLSRFTSQVGGGSAFFVRRLRAFMKTSRIILIIGIAHFALWWLSYAAMHLAGYNPFTQSSYSVFGRISFDAMSILSFPAILDTVYRLLHQPPTIVFVAFDSCVWALCLGSLVYIARRFRHEPAA